MTSERHY